MNMVAPHCRQHSASRRATSLVELLVVLTGCSVVLTLGGQILHRSMRSQVETRHFFDVERAALRLARQFRQDVHAARKATIEVKAAGDGPFLRLDLPGDQVVEYRRQAERIVRVLSRKDGSAGREDFTFSAAMKVGLQEESPPRRLVLTIITSADPRVDALYKAAPSVREAPVNLQAVALIGRHAGLLAGHEEETP